MSPRFITMKQPRMSGARTDAANAQATMNADETTEAGNAAAADLSEEQAAVQDIHPGERLE